MWRAPSTTEVGDQKYKFFFSKRSGRMRFRFWEEFLRGIRQKIVNFPRKKNTFSPQRTKGNEKYIVDRKEVSPTEFNASVRRMAKRVECKENVESKEHIFVKKEKKERKVKAVFYRLHFFDTHKHTFHSFVSFWLFLNFKNCFYAKMCFCVSHFRACVSVFPLFYFYICVLVGVKLRWDDSDRGVFRRLLLTVLERRLRFRNRHHADHR